MNTRPLHLAVIGVGALGRHHARLLAEMPDVHLVGVADPNPEQGAAVAEQCRTAWLADYRTLLDQQPLDAACVVVPTSWHRRVAEDCLLRGVHVLVEKPITPTVEEGRALCRLADERRLVLQVGHIERFNPAFQELFRRTAAPKYIRAERLAPYSFRSTDVSVVLDLMIHDLDLLLTLDRAAVTRVDALGICVCGGHPDVVQARIGFADGCLADLTASRVSPAPRRTFQVWSEAGCWTADLHEQQVTGYGPGPALRAGQWPRDLGRRPGADVAALKQQMFERFLTIEQPEILKRNALEDELRDFLHAVRTGSAPQVDGRAGVAALELAEQIERAVADHRWDGSESSRRGPHAHPLHQPSQAA